MDNTNKCCKDIAMNTIDIFNNENNKPILVLTDLPSPIGLPVYMLLSDVLETATELGKQMFIEEMRNKGVLL